MTDPGMKIESFCAVFCYTICDLSASVVFLSAFEKLRKRLFSFIMSVCPSVRMEQLGSHWKKFREIWCEYFSKICRENSNFIKIWQEKRTLYLKTNTHLWSYLAQFFFEWEIFQAKVVEKIKSHILCPIKFSITSAFNVGMLKNIVEASRPQMSIWHMLDTKVYEHTLRIYNTYCFSIATVVKRTCLNIKLYIQCLSCIIISQKTRILENILWKFIIDIIFPTGIFLIPWRIQRAAIISILRHSFKVPVSCGRPDGQTWRS